MRPICFAWGVGTPTVRSNGVPIPEVQSKALCWSHCRPPSKRGHLTPFRLPPGGRRRFDDPITLMAAVVVVNDFNLRCMSSRGEPGSPAEMRA